MRHVLPSFLLLAAAMPAFATIDTGLLALAPSGTQMISGVDVNRAKGSPFGQYMLNKINADNDGFHQMMQQTGFDPRRDVEDVLFVSVQTPATGSNLSFAVLVRGNFDQERIRKALLAKGASVQPFQGVEVLLENPKSSNPGGPNQHQAAFAFPDVDIAVMGDLTTVQQIITNRANPTPLDPALQQLVSSAGASHDAWFASLMGSGSFLTGNIIPQHAGQPIGPQALQSVLQSSGGILFGDVVQVSVDAVTRSAKDATALADVVRFATSMVQMQRQKDPRAGIFASSLDNMTLQTDGSDVHIAFSVPETSLEQLAALHAQAGVGVGIKATKPSAQ